MTDDGSTTRWWGEPWPSREEPAPVCEDDSKHIATPVGVACSMCREPIEDGDQGTAWPLIAAGHDGAPVNYGLAYNHIACVLHALRIELLHAFRIEP